MPSPGTLILIGCGGALLVQIVAFSVNLLIALYRAGGLKSEEELEAKLAPALQGEPTDLGARSLSITMVASWFFLAIAAAGVVWWGVQWLQRLASAA